MAKLTKKMQADLQSLLDTAESGHLGVRLSWFLETTVTAFIQRAHSYQSIYTRADLQAYIDTLRDLIDTKVHSR